MSGGIPNAPWPYHAKKVWRSPLELVPQNVSYGWAFAFVSIVSLVVLIA